MCPLCTSTNTREPAQFVRAKSKKETSNFQSIRSSQKCSTPSSSQLNKTNIQHSLRSKFLNIVQLAGLSLSIDNQGETRVFSPKCLTANRGSGWCQRTGELKKDSLLEIFQQQIVSPQTCPTTHFISSKFAKQVKAGDRNTVL